MCGARGCCGLIRRQVVVQVLPRQGRARPRRRPAGRHHLARGHRRRGPGAHRGRHRRLAVRVPGGADRGGRRRRGSRWRCSTSTNTSASRSPTRPASAATCASGSSTGSASSGATCSTARATWPGPRPAGAVSQAIAARPIDVAFVGIGENGHLAFNDPPADFTTEAAYLVVELDEACRRQQVGEGWFARLEEVPTRAISMSVRQILRAREILCIVPDRRKAEAVRATLHRRGDPAGAGLGPAQPPPRHPLPGPGLGGAAPSAERRRVGGSGRMKVELPGPVRPAGQRLRGGRLQRPATTPGGPGARPSPPCGPPG